MPLTLAHPAAVLPLIRLRVLDALPLIVGSITPDIGYYLPHQIRLYLPDPQGAHSFVGSFIFCLPVALVLLALLLAFQIPLLEPLPNGHRQFVASLIERFRSRKSYLVAAVPSVLIGVWSHIVWDSFTHRNRWAVQHFALLRETLELPLIGSLELFRALQYISSLIGLVVVIRCYVSAERRFVRANKPVGVGGNRAVLLGSLLALSAAIAAGKVIYQRGLSFPRLGIAGLTSGIAIFCVLWFISGLVLVMLRAYQTRPSERSAT
jgi:Domain of unknown function (DUF4184)